LTGWGRVFMLKGFAFRGLLGCDLGIGKPVGIRHGPATVIGDESCNLWSLSRWGWEGRGE
jgi:hypothetical protein